MLTYARTLTYVDVCRMLSGAASGRKKDSDEMLAADYVSAASKDYQPQAEFQAYIYTHVYTYIYIYMYACYTCIYIHTYIHMFIHLCLCVCVRVCVCACVCITYI